jgi:GTPase SAR1 family protein
LCRTIYNQLVQLYEEPYDEEKMLSYKPIIYTNILCGMKILCKRSQSQLADSNQEYCNRLMDMKEDADVEEDHVRMFEALWNDPAISALIKQLQNDNYDALPYWITNANRVFSSSYTPILADVLRSRAPTTGIVEKDMKFEGTDFLVIDTGGQRNERKKWIYTYDQAKAVIFVVSLTSYCQYLYEDGSSIAIVDSLELFETTANLEYFTQSEIYLFFNRIDVFEERIKSVPLSQTFPDYSGPSELHSCRQFIEEKFTTLIKDRQKKIHVHYMTATRLSTVQCAFESVMRSVAEKNSKQKPTTTQPYSPSC